MPIIFPAFFIGLALAIVFFFVFLRKHQKQLTKNRFLRVFIVAICVGEAVLAVSLIRHMF
jgi:hypothetical protein